MARCGRSGVAFLSVALVAFIFGASASHAQEPFTELDLGLTGVAECALAWGDYDSDGDLDLVLANKVYGNDGGTLVDISAGLTSVYESSLAWGDYDNDGDLDLALAGRDSSRIYRNNGGTFVNINAGLLALHDCSLAWGDYDNDGAADLAVSGWGDDEMFKIYRNEDGAFVDILAEVAGYFYCSLAWGDYDSDGDLDLAVAGCLQGPGATSRIYRNDGGALVEIDAGLADVDHSSLAWGDYDNDGDLDLAVAGGDDYGNLTSRIYSNDGGTFVDIDAGLTGVSSCSLAWGDYDNDGDLDLALAGYDGSIKISKIYRNDGGTFVDINAGLTGVYSCSLAWGDYDNDGDLDLVLSGQKGIPEHEVCKIYRNWLDVPNPPPSAPTGLSASAYWNRVVLAWEASTDAQTPQPGLTYNLRVGTTPGGSDIMSGMAIIGGGDDGKRLIPAMGNCQHNTSWTLRDLPDGTYYWSVQAIDTAFEGSPWAAEGVMEVPPKPDKESGCAAGAPGPAGLALCLLAAWLALQRPRSPLAARPPGNSRQRRRPTPAPGGHPASGSARRGARRARLGRDLGHLRLVR